jgi:glyoxylase-like metal-dependent hydrolase (beta-lactamase superfamily II)
MAIGDVTPVPDATDLYYLDTGMYDTEGYGSVYLLDAERPAVVDTGIGADREFVFEAVDEYLGGDLAYVLPTHVHLDHAGGAGFLVDRYPDATVLAHEIGVPHLVDPERLIAGTKAAVGDQWEFYDEPEPVPEDRIEGLAGGDEVDLGDRTLSVHHAPGHAPHQVVFHDDRDDAVFTADAAGIYVPELDSIEPTSPPTNFDLDQCRVDVSAIEGIDPELLCFAHFGPRRYSPARMEGYKRTLVEWVEAIRRERERLGDDEAVIEYFVENVEPDLVDAWNRRKARAEARLNVRGVLGFLDHASGE